jgi:hypothetical protein
MLSCQAHCPTQHEHGVLDSAKENEAHQEQERADSPDPPHCRASSGERE